MSIKTPADKNTIFRPNDKRHKLEDAAYAQFALLQQFRGIKPVKSTTINAYYGSF